MDDKLPYEVQKDGGSSYTVETTYGMVEGIKKLLPKTMERR